MPFDGADPVFHGRGDLAEAGGNCAATKPGTTRSVHATNFPDPPVDEVDQALLDRWDRLGQIREEVNKALDLARAAKTIGTSLEARVTIETPDDETAEFLRSFGEGLHFLFITSGSGWAPQRRRCVSIRSDRGAGRRRPTRPRRQVRPLLALHRRCRRGRGRWPTICKRCARQTSAIIEHGTGMSYRERRWPPAALVCHLRYGVIALDQPPRWVHTTALREARASGVDPGLAQLRVFPQPRWFVRLLHRYGPTVAHVDPDAAAAGGDRAMSWTTCARGWTSTTPPAGLFR